MGLNITQIIGLILYSMVCFALSFGFIQCESKRAQERITEAQEEAKKANDELETIKQENNKLRFVIERANEAVERSIQVVEEAQKKHEKRLDKVENDTSANDWLVCPVPDSVRDAFGEYCAISNDTSSGRTD